MLTSNDSPLPSAQSNGLSSLTPDSASSNSNHTAESFSPSPSSAQVFNFNATTTNSFQMENLTATPKGTTGAKSVCFHSVMGQPGHKITNV